MCFFRKKKAKVEIKTKYKVGDPVIFRYRGELTFGWIYTIHQNREESVLYDVQVGGQCPTIIPNIKEEELRIREEK